MNVIVASNPRSGTNWLLNTIALNFELPKYTPMPIDPKEIRLGDEDSLSKTHLAYYMLVGTEAINHGKIIYISREIRDTLVSMWKCDLGDINLEHLPFDKWLRSKPSEKWGITADNQAEGVFKHHQAWKSIKNVHYVTYEEVSTGFEKVVDKLAVFFDRDRLEEYQYPRKSDCIRPAGGIVGAWKEVFSKEDLEFVDQYLPEKDKIKKPAAKRKKAATKLSKKTK